MPTISVIVPVYKVEKYIHRCVDSILGQTFTDFELILVDDGSPDNCPAICDEYAAKDSRIHVIHQANGGLSAARNAGIDWAFANSDSEWLTFVDSDDWVHCEYLSFLYNTAIENQVKISICALLRVYETIHPSVEYYPIAILTPKEALMRCDNSLTAYACGVLYHRDCFQDIRFPTGKLFEDIFTTYKVLNTTDRIANTETKLYYYFVNENGITLERWRPDRIHQIEALEELLRVFKSDQRMYDSLYLSYLLTLFTQANRIKLAGRKRYFKYYHMVMRKLRANVIRAHAHGYIAVKDNCHYYETAFPIFMRLYWYWVAFCRKLGIKV